MKLVKFIETLSVDAVAKTAAVLAELQVKETVNTSVVLLERLAWDQGSIDACLKGLFEQNVIANDQLDLQTGDSNDCYYRFGNQSTRVTIISPASLDCIAKYRQKPRRMVAETGELYSKVSGPYWSSLPLTELAWIENALTGKAESESVIADWADWLILPDLKWAPRDPKTLYLVALLKAPLGSVRSIRDLRGSHIPLLKAFRDKVGELLCSKYALSIDQVRMYFHYPPTYHHLHVHVVALTVERPHGTAIGLAHLLDQVIDNLEADDEYYAKRTLFVSLSTEHALYRLIRQ